MDKSALGFESEKAIRFLSKYLPGGLKKPTLLHSTRVGLHLLERGYSRDVVIAGFLHDILEDAPEVSVKLLAHEFGIVVTQLVRANTKDASITNKQKQKEELIARCISEGKDATVIKAADILDNFFYYEGVGDVKQVEGHCKANAHLLIDNLPKDFWDYIFDDLGIKIYGD